MAFESINDTTFKIVFGKDEIEIGNKDAIEFKPHAKLKKWGEECFLSIERVMPVSVTPIQEDDKLKCSTLEEEIHFYKTDEKHFEFEVILKEKPLNNKLVFSIETKNLKFHYQPPLSQEETDMGFMRPENVVGSYAVYHSEEKGIYNDPVAAEKYKVGKAFHIYRPQAIDAIGSKVWCDLHVDENEGTLTVTIPQDFLDKAVYPIRHASGLRFGYEVGGTSSTSLNDAIFGGNYTIPVDGTGISLSLYQAEWGALEEIQGGVYKKSDYSWVENSETDVIAGPKTTKTFVALAFDNTPSFVKDTDYVLVFWGLDDVKIHFDAGQASGNYLHRQAIVWDVEFPNPYVPSVVLDEYKVSVYATYNEVLPPDVDYSREDKATLPVNDDDLSHAFTGEEYTKVAVDDNDYVDQIGHTYAVFEFKDKNDNNTDIITPTWIGKSDFAPDDYTVTLQIYNQTDTQWETLDIDEDTAANVEFTLTGLQDADLAKYYAADNWVSFRVYQKNV